VIRVSAFQHPPMRAGFRALALGTLAGGTGTSSIGQLRDKINRSYAGESAFSQNSCGLTRQLCWHFLDSFRPDLSAKSAAGTLTQVSAVQLLRDGRCGGILPPLGRAASQAPCLDRGRGPGGGAGGGEFAGREAVKSSGGYRRGKAGDPPTGVHVAVRIHPVVPASQADRRRCRPVIGQGPA